MTNDNRFVVAGAMLIGAGTLVVLRQILTASPNPQLGGLGQWVAGTEFPGLIMICAGAFLWCLGALLVPKITLEQSDLGRLSGPADARQRGEQVGPGAQGRDPKAAGPVGIESERDSGPGLE